jgi:hypothetical protein
MEFETRKCVICDYHFVPRRYNIVTCSPAHQAEHKINVQKLKRHNCREKLKTVVRRRILVEYLDRSTKKGWMQYMLANPSYFQFLLGQKPGQKDVHAYFQNNIRRGKALLELRKLFEEEIRMEDVHTFYSVHRPEERHGLLL